MVIVDHVVKKYGQVIVLDHVTLALEKGKIHGLIGRNGSGKTVLLKCICGLIKPTSGFVSIDGRVIRQDIDIPENLGAIVESPGFLPYHSGRHNLKLLASIRKQVSNTHIDEVMRLVGLDPKSRKWVSKYSMGMKQRLGIAQAIMENPSLLILDEPMNGLDNVGVRDMRALFLQLKAQGKTIILASHNKEDIDTLCDSVSEMDAGVLMQLR